MRNNKIKHFMEQSTFFKIFMQYITLVIDTVLTYGLMTNSHFNIWFLLIFIFDVICIMLYLYIYVADVDIRFYPSEDWDEYKKKIRRNGLLSGFVAIAFFVKILIELRG